MRLVEMKTKYDVARCNTDETNKMFVFEKDVLIGDSNAGIQNKNPLIP